MLPTRMNFSGAAVWQQVRSISKSRINMTVGISPSDKENRNSKVVPSERMQAFRKKLKLEPIPRVSPGMRFIDLMLVKTNPSTGEVISDAEKDPTKWGDWQNGGRVSDF